MNLLDRMMEDCTLLNHIRTDDRFGSYTDEWTEGATFKAAISKNMTTEQMIAEKRGITEAFIVVVRKGVVLDYHDVFKRNSDGEIFRVTSKTMDSEAHPASTVKIAKVSAERWDPYSESNGNSTEDVSEQF